MIVALPGIFSYLFFTFSPKSFRKGIYSKRKRINANGSKLFPFGKDQELSLLKVYPVFLQTQIISNKEPMDGDNALMLHFL